MCGGQRAARLPLVHMVVPLISTSNSFAPLADDDDRPSSSRNAASATEPSSVPEGSRVTWTEVMSALSAKRTIADSLGMDAGIADGWTFADHHATTSSRDPPTYSCNRVVGNRPEVGKPDLPKLIQALLNFSGSWKDFDTVYLFVDNRAMDTHERPAYWKFFAPWIRERCSWIGPLGERTTAAFIASSWHNGLEAVHFTWAGTFVLEAAVFLYPNLNFILADADCVPLALFEVGELRQLAMHLMRDSRKHSHLGSVLLVSEPHAEINAGWVCIGSRSQSATDYSEPKAAASDLVKSRQAFLRTEGGAAEPTLAAMSGLLATPMAEVKSRNCLDWCHAWALLGQWANFVAFPLPSRRTKDGGYVWSKHGHSHCLKPDMQTRVPSLLGWARPAFEQGALPPLSILPADHLLCVLPGSMLFQSEMLDAAYMRPPIFHAFSGDKMRWGEHLRNLADNGVVPLVASLVGMVGHPPLWQHCNGCDFVVGNKWKSLHRQGKMTLEQVAAVMKCWTKVDPPDLALFADLSYSVAQTDWYGLDDNHTPPNLIKTGFTNVGQQPVRGQEASVDARREIGWLCFQRLRETVDWQGGVEQTALKVYCTGLGGGDPPDDTYDVVLSCVARSPTYGATLARQDDWGSRRTTVGRTAAVHEFFMFTMSCAHGPQLWERIPGVPKAIVDKIPARAKEILDSAALLPAHRREAHPSWAAATRLLLALCHPTSIGMLWHWLARGVPPQNVPRQLTIHGFSAGSLNGLILHFLASRFYPTFQGATVIGAVACDPAYLMAPATVGVRKLSLIHYEGDELCVWRPSLQTRQVLTEKGMQITWIDQLPDDKLDVDWLGAGHHNYGHLVAIDLPQGTVTWNDLETNHPEVTPKVIFQTGPRRLLSWCMLQATDSQREFLAALAEEYGRIGGDPLGVAKQHGQADNEDALKRVLLDSVQVKLNRDTESRVVTQAVRTVLEAAPAHLLSYLLDYFLLQVQSNDFMYKAPYHASPALDLAWRAGNTHAISHKPLRQGCGDMHSLVIWTDSCHLFGVTSEHYLDRNPDVLANDAGRTSYIQAVKLDDVVAVAYRQAGRGLIVRVAICIKKNEKKKNRNKEESTGEKKLRFMTPISMTLVQLPQSVVLTFFPDLLRVSSVFYGVECQLADDRLEARGVWDVAGLQLISRTMNAHEIVSAISVRPERLPSGLGILAVPLPIEQRSEIARLQLVDTVVQTLERLIVPIGRLTVQEHQEWFADVAYPLVNTRDGHILGVATAMAMAGLTGRMDLCVAGLFGAGKSRAAAVMLVGMLIACPSAKVLVVCKENAAARSFLQLVESLKPPEGIRSAVGRLVSDDEYSGHYQKLDVPPSLRNKQILGKRALIATGGLLASELRCRWSKIREWTEGLTVTFVEEAQQYGGVNEVVVVSRLMAQSLVVFGGDKCQTPGGLNKEAESSSMARQKLISRQHGLRLESEQLQPVHLLRKFRSFVLHSNSPLAKELIDLAGTGDDHERVFTSSCDQFLESVGSLFPHLAMLKQQTGRFLDASSSIVRAAVLLLAASQDDSFFTAVSAKTNLEAAGATGHHRWHLMLPTSARVAPVTYTAVVATRYPELCVKKAHKWCVGTFARGGVDDMPGGFHTVLWLQGGSSTAKMNVTVNAAFETLVDHHVWGEEAQESLYVMCNNSQDVASLQHHTEAWNNPNKIRIETVASSASTTAKVAAVIQRGGCFLSGSFTDPVWAEDCAGRATVCLTRAISYTVLISPLEMMGMFGMAQVIGAKSLGINVLTDKDTKWPPPRLTMTQQQIVDSWSLDVNPDWSTVPLAIAFQAAGEHLPATDDKSKIRKGNFPQKVYRLRLVLVRAARWNVLAKHADIIVAAIAKKHPQVPLQLYDRRRYGEGIPWHHAFLWGYAQDGSRQPSFVIVPVPEDDMTLIRLMDGKEYSVSAAVDTPLRTLPGMYFFDAWRLAPCQAQRIVATDKRSEESPLENVIKEEEAPAWATSSASRKSTEVFSDPNVYELSRATSRALIAFDSPLRDNLIGMNKRSMELRPLEYIEVLESAFASVKSDWPFAKIGINLETVGAKFEGILRLIFLEYHLRDPGLARKTMQDASFQVFTQFMRHLSLLVTHIISLGRNVLITLYPRGTDRDLGFMLDPEYWFRCLMLESLTVMGVDSADSRERRAPWGVMKFLKAGEKKRPKAVSFELDKLMIWVPAPCAVEIAKDMATTSSYTSTSYKVERGCADPSSDRRFSFYSVNVKNKFLTLNPMQKQFPSVGSYFRIGALPPAVAQVFIRSVATKTEVRLPLFCPGLEEFAGDSPPSSLLPDNWVFGGDLAQRIYDEVMAMDAKSLMDSCRDMFNKQENCPVVFQRPDHPGFGELTRIQSSPFHEDPCRLWNSPLTVGWVARHAKDMVAVEKQDLTEARASAIRQTTVPAVTAADQVSIVLEPDEGEYQGSSAATQSDRTSHGGRAKFAKRR